MKSEHVRDTEPLFILVSSIELLGFVYAYKPKHNLLKQSVNLGTIQIDL